MAAPIQSSLGIQIDLVKTVHKDIYPAIDYKTTLKGSLKGKSVLITGAGRGLGKAMAIAYAYAGAKAVTLVARSTGEIDKVAEELKQINPEIIAYTHTADLTDVKSVDKCFSEAFKATGGIDICVANAGYLENNQTIEKSDPKEWWSTWEINVKGLYLTCRAFLRELGPNKKDKIIILTSSIGAFRTASGMSAYQTSKTACSRMAEYLDLENASEGLFAVAVHPGGVLTQLASQLPSERHALLQDTPELAAGFYVWLSLPSKEAWFLRGRYCSCGWDVKELLAISDKITASPDLLKTRTLVIPSAV